MGHVVADGMLVTVDEAKPITEAAAACMEMAKFDTMTARGPSVDAWPCELPRGHEGRHEAPSVGVVGWPCKPLPAGVKGGPDGTLTAFRCDCAHLIRQEASVVDGRVLWIHHAYRDAPVVVDGEAKGWAVCDCRLEPGCGGVVGRAIRGA